MLEFLPTLKVMGIITVGAWVLWLIKEDNDDDPKAR